MAKFLQSVSRRRSSAARVGTALSVVAMALLTGCGKPPTFQELIGGGGKAPDAIQSTAPQASSLPAPAPVDAPQPQPPAKADPAAVIAAFKMKPTYEIENSDVQGLIALGEGGAALDAINLSGSKVTDDGVKGIAALTGLLDLNASNTKITDGGLVEIGKATQLKKLDMSRTAITGAGLQFIADLDNLLELSVAGTQVGDNDYAHFKKLVKLESLNVSNTPTNGSGFKVFHSMPGRSALREIDVTHTGFGAFGFEHIKNSTKLEKLVAGASNTNDLSLRGFKALNLEHIDLAYNQVGDLGVKELGDCKKLKYVGLRNNQKVTNFWVNAAFSKNKNLEVLDLEGTGCSSQLVGPMKKLNKDLKITVGNATY